MSKTTLENSKKVKSKKKSVAEMMQDPEILKKAAEGANKDQRRTMQQNKAMHLWFQQIADTLNDAGLDMRKVLKPHIDIPWTKDNVKEFMWRPVQTAVCLKKSTTKLTPKEVTLIFDTFNRHLAKFGVHIPFPSIDEVLWGDLQDKNKKVK